MDKSIQAEMLSLVKKHSAMNDEFENKITDSANNIREHCKDSIVVNDSYGNSLLAIGNDDKVKDFSSYSFSNDTLNWPLWLALYNESWVFKRAIDKPAQDSIRAGISIQGEFDKKNEVNKRLKSYGNDLTQLLQWGALFGGSVAFAMFDNFSTEDYEKPFNATKVAQAKTMKFYVVDRWYGLQPDYDNVVTDMSSIDYGKPKYYTVTMADGKSYKYHHDYTIRYEHRTAPKLVKNGMLQGWGYSEGSHILNELCRDEKLKSSIQSLINKSLIEVIKMSGMRGIFMGADNENEDQLRKRLEMVNWGRGFNSLTFLDKEDEYSMNSFSGLGGLSDILQQNMWMIAAALEMQGVLFGDMKQGFANDSDALERYDETIHTRCEAYVRPILEKLLKFIYAMLNITEKPQFEFNSLLLKVKEKEQMESIEKFVNLCSKLLADGVITAKQYAEALKTYTTKSIIDFKLTDENINKMDENAHLMSEALDLDNLN